MDGYINRQLGSEWRVDRVFSVSLLETLNMKLHLAIGESHLTLSELSMREQGQRRLQTRKKVAEKA